MRWKAGGLLTVFVVGTLASACSGRRNVSEVIEVRQSTATLDFGGCSKLRVAVSVGFSHSCALLSDGTVECWGEGSHGELGNGAVVAPPYSVTRPQAVVGLDSVTAIAAGDYHTCALRADGTVKCWGTGNTGQLGNGSTGNAFTVVPVANLTSAIAISAGFGHTCALLADHTVRCWGANDRGQLGDGTGLDSSIPVKAIGLANVVAIDAGDSHNCALLTNGSAMCWGDDTYGEMGAASSPLGIASVPIAVSGLSGLSAISAGVNHTCALLGGGTVKCWGLNASGQLGNGTKTDSPTPVSVANLAGATGILAGSGNTCALLSDGTATCWGDNAAGELGNGTFSSSLGPVPVSGLSNVAGLSVSFTHGCAVLSDGKLDCWGSGANGELGNGTRTITAVPVSVAGDTFSPAGQVCRAGARVCDLPATCTGTSSACPAVVPPDAGAPACPQCSAVASAVSTGALHTCALLPGGGVECWGRNQYGQLGDGTVADSADPVVVLGISDAIAIAAGGWNTCALRANGTVSCWGDNQYGELGNGTMTNSSLPVPVSNLVNVVAITGGVGHMCALRADKTVACWGYNILGALGNGMPNACPPCGSSVPVQVVGLGDAVGISAGAGGYFTCATRSNGAVTCWGDNGSGQLATTSVTRSWTPIDVAGIANAISVSAGANHACALLADHTVACWGRGGNGELGNGATGNSVTPVVVTGLGDAAAVAAGTLFTCAVRSGGGVGCWGWNAWGQLSGSASQSSVPFNVAGITTANAIAAGGTHVCARIAGGALRCWGDDRYGQLGNGTPMFSSRVPLAVQCPATPSPTDGGADSGDGAGGAPIGAPCSLNVACASGLCVDGVCCVDACGGGDPLDCRACSTAKGGSMNGSCTPLVTTPVCRASAGPCDVEERCRSNSLDCPPDVFAPTTLVCRFGDACDIEETCPGNSAACPPDVLQPTGHVCSTNSDACETVEVCSGTSRGCPSSTPIPGCGGVIAGTVTWQGTPVTGPVASSLLLSGTGSDFWTARPDSSTGQYSSGVLRRDRYGVSLVGITCAVTEFNERIAWSAVDVFSMVTTTKDFELSNTAALVVGSKSASGALGPTTLVVNDGDCSGLATDSSGAFAGVFVPGSYTISERTQDGRNLSTTSFTALANQLIDLGTLASTIGAACSTEADCGGGPCVDGVCCNEACGGTDSTDCQACSVLEGAVADGTCTPISSAHTCRSKAGACDIAETCDGISTACPANQLAPAGQVCRPLAGACDVAETCSGGTAACPPDTFAAIGTVCHAGAAPCESTQVCSGDAVCPAAAPPPPSCNFMVKYTGARLLMANANGTTTPGKRRDDSRTTSAPSTVQITETSPFNNSHNADAFSVVDQGATMTVSTRLAGVAALGRLSGTVQSESSTDVLSSVDPTATFGRGLETMEWSDEVTVTSPTLPAGAAVQFLAQLDLDSQLGNVGGEVVAAQPAEPAYATATAVVGGTTVLTLTDRVTQPLVTRSTTALVNTRVGDKLVLNGRLQVYAMARLKLQTPVRVTADAGHTAIVRLVPVTSGASYVTASGRGLYVPDATPPVVTIDSPAAGAVVNRVVPVVISARDNASGVARIEAWAGTVRLGECKAASCTLSLDTRTFPDGPLSLRATAWDFEGNASAESRRQLVVDNAPPVFSNVPPSPVIAFATSTAGAKVNYTKPTACDARDGTVAVSCVSAPGAQFPLKKTAVVCTASDKRGNTSTATFTVWVQYQAPADGTFFLPPIRANGSSIFRIGRPVPVRFKLTGASAGITNLVARLIVTKISNTVQGTTVDTSDETVDDTDFIFKYRSAQKWYAYRWKTSNQTQGTYQLKADLGDEVLHQVNVSLTSSR